MTPPVAQDLPRRIAVAGRTVTLRAAAAEDAAILRDINVAASEGMVLHAWADMARPGESVQDVGLRRQHERIAAGAWQVIADADGCAAGLSTFPIPPDAADHPVPDDLPAILHPLERLERGAAGAFFVNVLGTAPRVRRQGYARALMALAEDDARRLGHDRIALVVLDVNAPARALYAALGYAVLDTAPVVTGDWQTDGSAWLLMGKTLA